MFKCSEVYQLPFCACNSKILGLVITHIKHFHTSRDRPRPARPFRGGPFKLKPRRQAKRAENFFSIIL